MRRISISRFRLLTTINDAGDQPVFRKWIYYGGYTMFFNLFSKNKDEFITAYAGKLAEAVLEDALDEDVLEEIGRAHV